MLLDQLVKLIFINMFGEPRSNSKGWKVIELGELVDDIRYGTSVRCMQTRIGYTILRIPNVVDGTVNFEDLKIRKFVRSRCV
jgi:type I restriction enzyme S subunit